MSLSVGIVGLPNVGKSTIFNALLKKQQALVANYPFATIDPNIGIVPVPDERLEKLADVVAFGTNSKSQIPSSKQITNNNVTNNAKRPPIVPATVTFIDIAGLVAGASQGEGLGNQFLSHIRETDLILEIIRFFRDDEIHHVAGKVDPATDKEVLESELILADLATLDKQPQPRVTVDKKSALKWEVVTRLRQELNQGKKARDVLSADEKQLVNDLHLITMKPLLYAINVSEDQICQNDLLATALTMLGLEGNKDMVVAISAKMEQDLSQLSEDDQKQYLADLGIHESGLERVIMKVYNLLELISFLTAGEKEVRAWKIKRGQTALDAAGEIHTDFMKKFIKAEVVDFETFVYLGGWKPCFDAGKVRLEGRDYIVKDGDVITFKIGA